MNFTEKINSDEILSNIRNNFNQEIYVVGGYVRDFLIKKETFDRDLLVVDEDAKEFSEKLAEFFDATFIALDEINKIYRLVLPNKLDYIDVTNPIEGSLSKDLARRDLTINSIAANLKSGEVIDLYNGISDIENKCINHINEQNFCDDPLRILRVFRFQAMYGFEISKYTMNAVCKYSTSIDKPAIERINYELLKLFSGKYTVKALINMDKANLLEEIFPFVNELKQVPPNMHHHLDLFNHSLETVNQIQILYENSSEKVKEHLEQIDFGGFPKLAHLKLAGFLHDIGKFSTWTIEEGRHRFIKHDDVGSKMAEKFIKTLHLSNKQIEYVSNLVKYHIYPSHVMSAPDITEKIMMRYVRKMDSNSIDAIILAQADRLSARGPEITDEIVENNIESLNKLLDFYLDVKENLKPLPKLLDGNEIIEILDIKPSRQLGEILSALKEAQISQDVTTKEHAIKFVRNYFEQNCT